MAYIGRNGNAVINLLAGQSVAVASYGPGTTKISIGAPVPGNFPPIFLPYATVTGGAAYFTFANATSVAIDAATGCEVEYDFGAQPGLTTSAYSGATGIVAHAGGTQALGTPLTASVNRISTCATAADSVLLPPAIAGRRVSLFNGGAASCTVYPQNNEGINSGAANAGFAVANGKGAIFDCPTPALWNAVLSA